MSLNRISNWSHKHGYCRFPSKKKQMPVEIKQWDVSHSFSVLDEGGVVH